VGQKAQGLKGNDVDYWNKVGELTSELNEGKTHIEKVETRGSAIVFNGCLKRGGTARGSGEKGGGARGEGSEGFPKVVIAKN